jgi:hypothetical protein
MLIGVDELKVPSDRTATLTEFGRGTLTDLTVEEEPSIFDTTKELPDLWIETVPDQDTSNS